jgi:SnoaL-like domain
VETDADMPALDNRSEHLLKELLDRQTITDLIHRYCRSVDRLDPDLGATIWHEHGEIDLSGLYTGNGRQWMKHTCAIHREKVLVHSHRMSNVTIRLDGDDAGSESYVVATVRMMEDGKLRQWTHWGRYIDRWSRRDGRWGIDKRLYLEDLADVVDASPTGLVTGKRDRADPSYAALEPAKTSLFNQDVSPHE